MCLDFFDDSAFKWDYDRWCPVVRRALCTPQAGTMTKLMGKANSMTSTLTSKLITGASCLTLAVAALGLVATPALADGTHGAKRHAVNAEADSNIHVQIDTSKLVRIKGMPTTAVIGNPAIADVQLLEGGILFIQGRGYGSTNLIVLDGNGRSIINTTVAVIPPEEGIVAMYQGSSPNNYACNPRCTRYPMPGEDGDAYGAASTSYESYAGRALNGGGGQGAGRNY